DDYILGDWWTAIPCSFVLIGQDLDPTLIPDLAIRGSRQVNVRLLIVWSHLQVYQWARRKETRGDTDQDGQQEGTNHGNNSSVMFDSNSPIIGRPSPSDPASGFFR